MKFPRLKKIIPALCFSVLPACGCSNTGPVQGADPLYIVRDGRPAAAVVTAKNPSPAAAFAVDELLYHVKLATGAELPVLRETDDISPYGSRIFIGETERAEAAGIKTAGFGHDEYIIRRLGQEVFVLGKETPETEPAGRVRPYGRYDERESYSGTLFGVYDLLERYAGARWLWPGELGTYVPGTGTLSVFDHPDLRAAPKISAREFSWFTIGSSGWPSSAHYYPEEGRLARSYHATPEIRRLAYSDEGMEAYRGDKEAFLIRHRLGSGREKPFLRVHTMHDLWGKYGEEHPEWFMMHEDGTRGHVPGKTHPLGIASCVSNPELRRAIVNDFWDGGNHLGLGEVDVRGFCRCEECRRWDGPQPAGGEYPAFAAPDYTPSAVSARYARFWKKIYDMAVERNPDVKITSYIYWNYFPAPLQDIELNRNIYGEFCPWTGDVSYPMSEERDKWYREQWLGWRETGISLDYRPNHFHYGYVMPYFSTRQAGEFFKFAHENGMDGFQFDHLFGHWATRGPMLYMYMRLGWDPEKDIDDIRAEYFSAFGPAAEYIEEYFDFWEGHSGRIHGPNSLSAGRQYPAELFEEAGALLERARAAASGSDNPGYADRVEFIRLGLEHARLASEFIRTLRPQGGIPVDSREDFYAAQEALRALIEFRREHEHLYIGDFLDASKRENRHIDIGALLDSDFDDVRVDLLPGELEKPWGQWYFRKDEENAGVKQEWYAPGEASGIRRAAEGPPAHLFERNLWTPVEVPQFLSATDIGPYLGYGWYASTFKVPGDWEGYIDAENIERPIVLHFESVDEQAWVYVNGSFAGEHTAESEDMPPGMLWNRPFSVEAGPDLLSPGEEALVVVRTHASAGEAGIWQPVRVIVPRP